MTKSMGFGVGILPDHQETRFSLFPVAFVDQSFPRCLSFLSWKMGTIPAPMLSSVMKTVSDDPATSGGMWCLANVS